MFASKAAKLFKIIKTFYEEKVCICPKGSKVTARGVRALKKYTDFVEVKLNITII